MISRKARTMIAASVCGAALIVPAAATSASAHGVQSSGHGIGASQGLGRHHGHGLSALTAAQKQEIQSTYRAAVKAAFDKYLATTVDERATYKAARAAATTKAERVAARKAYRAATTTERATLKAEVKAAKAAKRAAIKAILAAA